MRSKQNLSEPQEAKIEALRMNCTEVLKDATANHIAARLGPPCKLRLSLGVSYSK